MIDAPSAGRNDVCNLSGTLGVERLIGSEIRRFLFLDRAIVLHLLLPSSTLLSLKRIK